MDGFKKTVKMACFKEGGGVQNMMKRGGKAKKAVPAIAKKDMGPMSKMSAPMEDLSLIHI